MNQPSNGFGSACSVLSGMVHSEFWSLLGGYQHSPWKGTQMPPVGQTSGPAGRGWGFEAGLIPAHSPMVSRTRTSPPIPIHRFTGLLGGSGDRLGRRCASRKTRPPTTSRTPSKIAISRTEAASPSMSRTLHRLQRTGSCQYCWPTGAGSRCASALLCGLAADSEPGVACSSVPIRSLFRGERDNWRTKDV